MGLALMIGDFEAIATAGWRGPNHTFSTYSLLKRFCAIKFGPPQTTKASFHKNHWTLFYDEIIVFDDMLFFWLDWNVLRCRNWMFCQNNKAKNKIVNMRIVLFINTFREKFGQNYKDHIIYRISSMKWTIISLK